MIDAFSDHYANEYAPSWLSCLDESMNSWLDKFCLGFMSVPRKPHPLGNEYHLIADGDDGKAIMWRIKLQEGKDRPKDAGGEDWAFPSEFEGFNSVSMANQTIYLPTRQFTFTCSVAEANAVMCRVRATKENATPQLEFQRTLAMKMLNNKIMDDGMLNGLPMRKKRRSRASDLVEHELCTRPPNTGIWKTATNAWSKIGTRYAKTKCHGCKTKIRTYCKCNKKIPLCTECYGKHILEVNNTF